MRLTCQIKASSVIATFAMVNQVLSISAMLSFAVGCFPTASSTLEGSESTCFNQDYRLSSSLCLRLSRFGSLGCLAVAIFEMGVVFGYCLRRIHLEAETPCLQSFSHSFLHLLNNQVVLSGSSSLALNACFRRVEKEENYH